MANQISLIIQRSRGVFGKSQKRHPAISIAWQSFPNNEAALTGANVSRVAAIEAVPEIRRDENNGTAVASAPSSQIEQTYLPIQVATVAGVQTSRPV
jgi:hypothetical protein